MLDLVQSVEPGGVILDPFCGNATTGAACIQEGRLFLGFEIDPFWVAAGNKRLDRERERLGEVAPSAARVNEQAGLFAEVSR
jgi:DNA modification methylase